ncbi:hypothetical protein AB0N62_04925 [Streptomyces sp. NPDC093982]|uniref:hypothetical protein n=1 Tax=Streptomyces sp. NPDC093982 TaxID=3155077 RepID=UPI0034404FD5
MTTRPSVSRRIAAAVLGVERPGRGPRDVTARRDLPYGRRLLAAVLGVRAEARQIAALPKTRGRIDEADAGSAGARIDEADASSAGARVETSTETRAGATNPSPQTPSQNETSELPTTPVAPVPSVAVEQDSPPHPPVEREEPWERVGPEEPPSTPPRRPPRRSYAGVGVRSTPQHLLVEDRRDYERLLDEALHTAPDRQGLTAVGRRLHPEQLRTMALNASPIITAAAATEYQHYVRVREELRDPAAHPRGSDVTEAAPASSMRTVGETTGAGAIAVAVVLTPVLAGTAATIFLGVGHLLELVGRASSFSGGLITTGWVFGAVTAAAILVAAVGLLLSALRNRPATENEEYSESSTEVDRAREAWRAALLERGIHPFLRDALADPGTASAQYRATPSGGRIPQLGYSRPGFSSPEDETEQGPRPSFTGTDFASSDFTTPDFTSPDFGGPEHEPE